MGEAKQVVADPGEIAATKDQLIAAIQAGANQADIRNFERAIWQLFDRAHATKVLLEANNSLRTTLSRQAELLAAALKDCGGQEQPAFEEWASKAGFDMTEHPLHWLFLNEQTSAARDGWKAALAYARTASSTLDAIRDELKGEQG